MSVGALAVIFATTSTGNVVISDMNHCIDPNIEISLVALIPSVVSF